MAGLGKYHMGADMAGLGKYHMGGYGQIGVYRVKACFHVSVCINSNATQTQTQAQLVLPCVRILICVKSELTGYI